MAEGILIGILIVVSFAFVMCIEGFCIDVINKYLEYQKLLKTDCTNLKQEDLYKLRKKINSIYHLSYFQIVYAKEKVVIKIKKNYFDFGTEDSSLTMLFSEDNMFKMQISK